MRSWRLLLVVIGLNLVLTNGEEQFQQVEEFGKIFGNIEAVMDPTVDPCENFYKFVCGRFTNEALTSSDYAKKEIKRRLVLKYEQEEPLESENKLTIIKHSKNLYRSCKKTKNKKNLNDFILQDLEAIGGWPAVKGDSWNPSAFDWKRSVFKAGKYNEWKNYLFSIRLVESMFAKDEIFLEFLPVAYDHQSALEFAASLGGNNPIVIEELKKVKEFLKNFLEKYSSHLNAERNPMKITLQNLTDKYPHYPWTEHFKNIISDTKLNKTFVVRNPTIIENLFSLLNNTDKRMLANLAAWNRVSDLQEFIKKYDSVEDCFDIVLNVIGPAPSLMYYHEFVHDNKTIEANKLAITISNKIREQFIEMLRNSDWISNKTYLIEKLEKLQYQFGFPPDPSLDTLMNEYYENLESNQTNFYEALRSISEFHRRVTNNITPVKRFREVIGYFQATVNSPEATYSEYTNDILVRLALLQHQFIDPNNPMWMNFASFGAMIGHEFGKSLNPELISYNAKAELIPDSPNRTMFIGYHKKIVCLNDIYRAIANVSDEFILHYYFDLNTTPEDVADNLGFYGAYLAYKNSSVKGNSQTLHQKTYSPDQLFWISATNRLCEKEKLMTEEFKRAVMYRNIFRNTNELRVLASLSNIEGFSKDFNCPANSQMNRQKRCKIF